VLPGWEARDGLPAWQHRLPWGSSLACCVQVRAVSHAAPAAAAQPGAAFPGLQTCRKAAITTRILGCVHELCSKRIHVTKRDLFYTDVKLFEVAALQLLLLPCAQQPPWPLP